MLVAFACYKLYEIGVLWKSMLRRVFILCAELSGGIFLFMLNIILLVFY